MRNLDPRAVDRARWRLQGRRDPVRCAQSLVDRLEAERRAVGEMDVLVLVPSGRVGRLLVRGHGLLHAQWRDSPRDCGWRAGYVSRDGCWVRFRSPDGWRVTGLIVDRA